MLQHRRPDGLFLNSILDRAAQAGVGQLRVRIDLQTQTFRSLKANNGVAVIRGASDEAIVLNAHVDGWFDGAGDNGDGLAVLVGLARHFAKPPNRPSAQSYLSPAPAITRRHQAGAVSSPPIRSSRKRR